MNRPRETADPERIYLAPRCCTDPDEGRIWCEDDVWPLDDCPETASGVPYVLATRLTELEAERDTYRQRARDFCDKAFANHRRAEAAEEAGRQKATAEIVAWLREQPSMVAVSPDHVRAYNSVMLALAIESGQHLTPPPPNSEIDRG